MLRSLILGIAAACVVAAPDKKPPAAQAQNDRITIAATLATGKEAARQELGAELPADFVLVKITVTPKPGQDLAVHRDDFLLRSDKDGQKSQAFAPSQIAGPSALVITQGGRGGFMAENPGPAWGGIGGPPRRMGGDSAVVGNAGESSARADAQSGIGKKAVDPLLAALQQKALPEKTTSQPISGLLYFQLEGKHKPKELELRYDGPAGKLALRFHQ